MPVDALDHHIPDLPQQGQYWIAPDAHVIGLVKISPDVGIWFGAVVRGDNEPIDIREGTNIQEGCMLHADPGFPLTIGPGCTVGHHAILHGCTIGAGTLIGMGAAVLNGAKIGNNCLVGAHALVTEGKEFPDGSLIIGSPARAVRQLSEKGIEGLREAARDYVQKLHRYTAGMKRIDA